MSIPGPASSSPASAAAPGVAAAAVQGALTPVELNRLRWRCRRGMLENDLILTRFLDARGGTLDAAQVAALDRLLALTDGELWDLLSARAEPEDAALAPLLEQLRAA
jgi:antitoxin CptB